MGLKDKYNFGCASCHKANLKGFFLDFTWLKDNNTRLTSSASVAEPTGKPKLLVNLSNSAGVTPSCKRIVIFYIAWELGMRMLILLKINNR